MRSGFGWGTGLQRVWAAQSVARNFSADAARCEWARAWFRQRRNNSSEAEKEEFDGAY
jgi:hypothetical protein